MSKTKEVPFCYYCDEMKSPNTVHYKCPYKKMNVEQQIFRLFESNEVLSANEISESTEYEKNYVSRTLSRLEKLELIREIFPPLGSKVDRRVKYFIKIKEFEI